VAGDLATDLDRATVEALAYLWGPHVSQAEVRRRLLAAACKRARRDKHVAQLAGVFAEARAAARTRQPAVLLPKVVPLRRRQGR
jgi:hypothetical protein